LVPVFTPQIKDYTVELPRDASSVKITADPTSSRCTMTMNGEAAEAGKPHAVKVTAPKLEIDVKSPDGTQMAVYTVTVSKR
jgi:hypothetical protein